MLLGSLHYSMQLSQHSPTMFFVCLLSRYNIRFWSEPAASRPLRISLAQDSQAVGRLDLEPPNSTAFRGRHRSLWRRPHGHQVLRCTARSSPCHLSPPEPDAMRKSIALISFTMQNKCIEWGECGIHTILWMECDKRFLMRFIGVEAYKLCVRNTRCLCSNPLVATRWSIGGKTPWRWRTESRAFSWQGRRPDSPRPFPWLSWQGNRRRCRRPAREAIVSQGEELCLRLDIFRCGLKIPQTLHQPLPPSLSIYFSLSAQMRPAK